MTSARTGKLRITQAEEQDIPLILSFVRKLAEYEKLLDRVITDERTLRENLFGEQRTAEVIFAYVDDQPAAFAVYFQNFSTFVGRAGIYLEDLFVEPSYRSRGVGKALLIYLANLVKQRGAYCLQWAVLDWNKPAIDFYHKLGAISLDDWKIFRLSGSALDRLAETPE